MRFDELVFFLLWVTFTENQKIANSCIHTMQLLLVNFARQSIVRNKRGSNLFYLDRDARQAAKQPVECLVT